jgi:hypothetical protein
MLTTAGYGVVELKLFSFVLWIRNSQPFYRVHMTSCGIVVPGLGSKIYNILGSQLIYFLEKSTSIKHITLYCPVLYFLGINTTMQHTEIDGSIFYLPGTNTTVSLNIY